MGTERDFVVKKGLKVAEDIELGHASDTTIARASAGQITVEGTAVVLAGGANHDGFSDFVANEHIDHTGVTLTAGDGLSGGGTIAANRTFAVEAAQTTITSVLNTSLVAGRDAHNQIKFSTDDQIIFRVGNADGVIFKASGEIEATKFDGDLEGNADTATSAGTVGVSPNNAAGSFVNENNLIMFLPDGDSSTGAGNYRPESSTAFHYNPSTTILTVPKITSTFTGNVTGNASGSAGTVTSIGNLTGDVTSSNRATTIANNAVTLAKMAGLARGKIIYGDSNGDPAALALGSNGQVLTTNGTDISWGSAGGGASALDDLSDAVTTSNSNVGIGPNALDSLTENSGNFNVALGVSAATNVTSGDYNLAIGMNSLFTSTTGASNVSLGHFSNYGVTDGKWNIAVGHNAGRGTTSGDGNISIGYQTGAQNTSTGGYNTGVGYGALTAVTTGGSNLAFGFQSGDNITTGDNNVVIGAADVPSATADSQLSISDGDGGTTWIQGNSDGIVLGALTPLFYERQSLDTSAVDFRVPVTGSSTANPNGYPMPFAGKVVAASFLFTGTIADDTNTNTIRIRKNGGSSGGDIKEFTFTGGDLLHPSGNTLVKSGSDVLLTFDVGDIIQIKRQGGSTDLNNAQAMLWVSYNF